MQATGSTPVPPSPPRSPDSQQVVGYRPKPRSDVEPAPIEPKHDGPDEMVRYHPILCFTFKVFSSPYDNPTTSDAQEPNYESAYPAQKYSNQFNQSNPPCFPQPINTGYASEGPYQDMGQANYPDIANPPYQDTRPAFDSFTQPYDTHDSSALFMTYPDGVAPGNYTSYSKESTQYSNYQDVCVVFMK